MHTYGKYQLCASYNSRAQSRMRNHWTQRSRKKIQICVVVHHTKDSIHSTAIYTYCSQQHSGCNAADLDPTLRLGRQSDRHLNQSRGLERWIYLAGAVLDDEVAVLADGAGLLRVGLGRAGVGIRLEVVLLGVRHLLSSKDQGRSRIPWRVLKNPVAWRRRRIDQHANKIRGREKLKLWSDEGRERLALWYLVRESVGERDLERRRSSGGGGKSGTTGGGGNLLGAERNEAEGGFWVVGHWAGIYAHQPSWLYGIYRIYSIVHETVVSVIVSNGGYDRLSEFWAHWVWQQLPWLVVTIIFTHIFWWYMFLVFILSCYLVSSYVA